MTVTISAPAAAIERLRGFEVGTYQYRAWRGEAPDGEHTLKRDLSLALSVATPQRETTMSELGVVALDSPEASNRRLDPVYLALCQLDQHLHSVPGLEPLHEEVHLAAYAYVTGDDSELRVHQAKRTPIRGPAQ